MFKPVSSKLNLTQMEENVLRLWKGRHVFEKSGEQRHGGTEYVFYEGPPTANGKPGIHHVLARVFKDIFPRYKSMRGYHVSRRGGWDTHGLPVEIEVEKRLGFTNKTQIESYGVAQFNALCRQSAFEYIQDWERLTERIAYWVSFDQAYVTFTNEYIESVWWILKTFWERGLIYQGYKVVPYCPRCGTPLSDHEVALGYAPAVDPSVFIRLPLVEDPRTSLLVWTTTPWTLPGNVAVAVHPEVDYVVVERALAATSPGETGSERLIVAQDLVSKVFGAEPVQIVETFKGRKLKGLRYRPLFTFLPADKPAYRVVLGDFVTTADGTGLVHLAPAFGAEDMQAALEHDLPILQTVAEDGTFIQEVRPWRGMFVKDADPHIIRDLLARGLLHHAETYSHTYPFCWRCTTPLLYLARGTWYLRTTEFKDRLVALNERINWIPDNIKHGRFGNWLENNVDWALGRERYWGTPLPIWECPACHHQLCVGSLSELAEYARRDLAGLDLHRPSVDEILFPCPECGATAGGQMQRIPELIDVWFDSGAMPVAQWHYPFENAAIFETQFPADFICEGVDQTRGWFYSLHAISTLLFERACFKNVICLGLVQDAEGRKMSKSRGNAINPWDVINVYGADAVRWCLYTASPPGQERRFSAELVGEVVRSFTLTLWNVYAFFVTYANLDRWSPALPPPPLAGDGPYLGPANALDAWLLSELHTLVRDITTALETYDVVGATRPIQAFVENLSRWYVRRSRRRFWKSESDADKRSAYAALYETLATLSRLLAPTMPFLADELYQNLVYNLNPAAPESVHLTNWPVFDAARIDPALNAGMALVMRLASLGHAARQSAGIKVRQPLLEAAFAVSSAEEAGWLEQFAGLLADELNVKRVRPLNSAGEVAAYSLNPLPKQLGQKYRSQFPALKAALLALDPEPAARSLLAGKPLTVFIKGQTFEILPEEVEVRVTAHSGLVVAADGPYLAALVTDLPPELVREGLAREFIRRLQDFRKQADLEITDRIRLSVTATPRLAEALSEHQAAIMGETLAVAFSQYMPVAGRSESAGQLAGAKLTAFEFDGEQATVAISKAE